MSKIKLLVADIDGMFYQSATTTFEESMVKFRDKFNNMIEKSGCSHYVAFYSKGRYFRHDIASSYKANRTQEPPRFMKALKEWAIVEFNLVTIPNIEADDAVVFWSNLLNWNDVSIPEGYVIPDEIIISSPDKDILCSVPGNHFNYSYRIKSESKIKPKEELTDEDVEKGYWIDTSRDESVVFKNTQMLTGDSADNISGIPGIGPVKAKKLLDSMPEDAQVELFLLYQYILFCRNTSKAIYEFQKNYRLLHMLENVNDFLTEDLPIPQVPELIEVLRNNNEIEINTEF